MTTKKNISFFQSIKSLLKNWNVFSGTCSRKEFWYGQIFIFFSYLLCFALLFVGMYVFGLIDAPAWLGFIWLFLLVNLYVFLGILYWTQFVRRYHDVGLSGQFFWLNILSNVFMGFGDKITNSTHIVFDVVGFSLLVVCYILASLPSKKFKNYKPIVKHRI